MVKASSSLDNLRKGRGQKKKLGHKSYSIKLSPEAKRAVEAIAESFHCVHGNNGSISSLLKKLASKELMIVETPPSWEEKSTSTPKIKPEVLPNPDEILGENFPSMQEKPSKMEQSNEESSSAHQNDQKPSTAASL